MALRDRTSWRSCAWIARFRPSSLTRAPGGDLIRARAAGEQDQVLVQLEPDAVVAVDPTRGDVPLVAGEHALHGVSEADPVALRARPRLLEGGDP